MKAFKEWAVVCDALARGRQIVILRKGGILEARSGFALESREFLLFPSYVHQDASQVTEGTPSPRPDPVRITHLARVIEAKKIEDRTALHRLRPFHIYSDAIVEERFSRWQDAGVHALLVRVARLPSPLDVPRAGSYEGCKSWFDLQIEADPRRATDVLSDEAFAKLKAKALAAI